MVKHGIKSIAARAGVSPATVSLSLKDDPRVAEKTKAKVKALVKELGYIPNNFGRALQANKSSLIGFLSPCVNRSYLDEILQGCGEFASEKDYGLLVAIPSGGDEEEIRQLKIFQGKRVDGIIVSGCHPATIKMLLDINEHGTPVIFSSGNSAIKNMFPVVKNDDLKTGVIAAEYLISLGHERLAYCFSGIMNERYQSSLECCMQNGLSGYRRLKTESELEELLKSNDRPTGIIAYSDNDAVRVIEIAAKAGLKIPEDLSVIGVDDSPIASLPAYNLTTIAPQKKNIGRYAVEMLLDRIAGKKRESLFLEPELIIRKTTRAVRQ
jgi:LacI family transcriptional regulator, galactose operon repressor